MSNYLSNSIISNVGSTFKRHTTKTVPLNRGIAFNKKSHKLETVIKIPVVQKLTEVPNQTWVAYTLSNKNHAEKRAEIFRCQQETGTISRTIMQTLKRGGMVSGDKVNKFAIGIDFLVQNKKNVTSHMINTLADGVQQLTYQIYLLQRQDQDVDSTDISALAKGIDTLLTNKPQSDPSGMVGVLNTEVIKLTNKINALQGPNQDVDSKDISALARGINTLHTYNPGAVSLAMVNGLAKGIDTLHTYNPRFVSRDMVEVLTKEIKSLQTNNLEPVSRDMVNGLAKGIDTLHTYNPRFVSRDMVNTLTKGIDTLHTNNPESVSRDMVNGLARGINTLHTNNPESVSLDMVNVLAKGIDTLHTYNPGAVSRGMVKVLTAEVTKLNDKIKALQRQNQDVDSKDISALARGINTLHTDNPRSVSLGMVNALAKGIESLQTNNPEPVSLDMVEVLAKGIKSLLSQNIKKDLSFELKILSIETLKNIESDFLSRSISQDNIGNILGKYRTLYETSINIDKILSGKELNKYNNPKFTKNEQGLNSQYYYKALDGEICSTIHTAQELFNFMQSFKILGDFYDSIEKLSKNGKDLQYDLNTEKIRNDVRVATPRNALNRNNPLVKEFSAIYNLTAAAERVTKDTIKCNAELQATFPLKELQETFHLDVNAYKNCFKAVTDKLAKQLKINATLNGLKSLRDIQDLLTSNLDSLKKEERTTLATDNITDINIFIENFSKAKGRKNSTIELNNNKITLKEKKDETVTINISDEETKKQFIELLNNIKNTLCKGNGNTYATLVHIAHRILLRAPLNQITEHNGAPKAKEKITIINCQNLVKANEFVKKLGNILKAVNELNIRNTEIHEFKVDEQTYYLTACIDAKKGKYEHQTFNIFYKDEENQEIYNLNLNPQGGLMTFIDNIKFSDKEKYIEARFPKQ